MFETSPARTHSWFAIVCVVIACGASEFAAAQSSMECGQALKPEQIDLKSVSLVDIAYLDMVDETRYDQLKRDNKIGGKIPIKGVVVDFTGNFNKFRESWSTFKRLTQYSLSQSESLAYASSRLSKDSLDAFVACKRLNARGLFLFANGEPRGNGDVTLTLEWTPPGTANSPITVELSLRNGVTEKTHFVIGVNSGVSFLVGRKDTSAPLDVVANGKVRSANFESKYLDPGPPLLVQPPAIWREETRANAWQWMEDYLNQCRPAEASGIETTLFSVSGHPNYFYTTRLRCRVDASEQWWDIETKVVSHGVKAPTADHKYGEGSKYLGIIYGLSGNTIVFAVPRL